MTMPLEDIPANVQRRITSSSTIRKYNSGNVSTGSIPAGTPVAIQNMLKTTTELGDNGLFPPPSSRLPRTNSHRLLRNNGAGSFDGIYANAFRSRPGLRFRSSDSIRGLGIPHSRSDLSRGDAIRLSPASDHHHPRSRQHRSQMKQHPHHHMYRSDSTSQNLRSHRSMATLRYKEDPYWTHTSSSSRHQMFENDPRHTARASAIRVPSHYRPPPSRLPFSQTPSIITSTSSPVSAMSAGPLLRTYHPSYNASIASMPRYASPQPVRDMRLDRRQAPPRTTTPSLLGVSGSRINSTTSLNRLSRSTTRSGTPLYYDYSEAFQEEKMPYLPAMNDRAPPSSIVPVIHELDVPQSSRMAHNLFKMRPGSKHAPLELPTEHNRTLSEQSKYACRGTSSSEELRGSKTRSEVPLQKPCLRTTTQIEGQESATSTIQIQHGDRLPELASTKLPAPGTSMLLGESPADAPHSVGITRHRTSSIASTFFSNASRSSRDLTMLAARVHSPNSRTTDCRMRCQGSDNAADDKDFANEVKTGERQSLSSGKWKLPSFSFRPLSIGLNSTGIRPRTSPANPSFRFPDIISPQPGRPMSSQSRRHFSNILDFEDGVQAEQRSHKDSLTDLSPAERPDFEEEDSDIAACPKIQQFNREEILNVIQADQWNSVGNFLSQRNNARFSEVTSHDKSTIESLLDHHIECLGLQPGSLSPNLEEDAGPVMSSTVGESTNNTTEIPDLPVLPSAEILIRPLTSGSCRVTSMNSSDYRRLIPRRLFASINGTVPSFPPALSDFDFTRLTFSRSNSAQLSYGWQTLTSDSEGHLIVGPTQSSILSGEWGDIDTDENIKRYKLRRRRALSIPPQPQMDSYLKSPEIASTIYSIPSHWRPRSEITARQASHRRRKMRLHLKAVTRRSSKHLRAEGKKDTSIGENGNTRALLEMQNVTSMVDGYAELSAGSIVASEESLDLPSPPAASPSIPNRWSSILAAMPLPGRGGLQTIRKASTRSKRSKISNASIVEPVNSTRLSSQAQIRESSLTTPSVRRLAKPDLGPPLSSSELHLSVPYPEISYLGRPALRESKSFFSDSPSKRDQSITRKPWKLSSLRHVMLPRSPVGTAPSTPRSFSKNNKMIISHSCRLKDQQVLNEESFDTHTKPMSDFSFKKQKLVGKVKEWWKRHCVQKRFSTWKRNSEMGGVLV